MFPLTESSRCDYQRGRNVALLVVVAQLLWGFLTSFVRDEIDCEYRTVSEFVGICPEGGFFVVLGTFIHLFSGDRRCAFGIKKFSGYVVLLLPPVSYCSQAFITLYQSQWRLTRTRSQERVHARVVTNAFTLDRVSTPPLVSQATNTPILSRSHRP